MSKPLIVLIAFFGLLFGSQTLVMPSIQNGSGLLTQTRHTNVVFDPGVHGQTSLCAVQTTTRFAGISVFGQRSWALSADKCQSNIAGISGDSLQRYGVFQSLGMLATDRPVWTPKTFAVAFEFWLFAVVIFLWPKPNFRLKLKRQVANLFGTNDKDKIRLLTGILMLVKCQKPMTLTQWNYVHSVCLEFKLKGEDLLKMEHIVRQMPEKSTDIKDVLKMVRPISHEMRSQFYEIATNMLSANGHLSATQFGHLSVLSKLVPQKAETKLRKAGLNPSAVGLYRTTQARAF